MDPKIAARFNDQILQTALQQYDIRADQIELLDGFESFIYRFERPDGKFILRIGHSGRRSPELIHGEVDWINYLADGGAKVARAIHSPVGNLVESVPDGHGEEFVCTAFVHAPGEPAKRAKVNERVFRNYGRLMGRMHALAKIYRLPNPAWKRPEWDAPENNTGLHQMPNKEAIARGKLQSLLEYLTALPRPADGYGMIHQDAHPGNFYVDSDDTLTLFDFDDCVYGHFIYDIAMVVFYTSDGEPDPAAFIADFMPIFLSGYRQENRLDPAWLAELPHFLKLREIDLFAVIHASFADGDNPDHPWCARYMKGRRQKIENDVPYLEFDWSSLAKYL